MEQDKAQNAVMKKISAIEEKLPLLNADFPKEHNNRTNRKALVRLAHYDYLLFLLSQNPSPSYRQRVAVLLHNAETLLDLEVSKEGIGKAKTREAYLLEKATIDLIDQHSRALVMALHYYEKASKILCQMLVSMGDELLRKDTGKSILYPDGKPAEALSLSDELQELLQEYRECYRFLSVFDYAVSRMGAAIKVPEYSLLVQQHLRILENGLPQKAMAAAALAGQELKGLQDPVPEEIMEGCWNELEQAHGLAGMLNDFVGAIAQLDSLVGKKISR